jgi:drug/metabolite transporter (DMT)-like permease
MKARVSDFSAIVFAVVGFTCWVLADSCIKWVGQFNVPPYEIVAFMGLFMAVTLTIHAALSRNFASLRPRSVGRQLLRSMLDMANNIGVIVALRHLSLTMFYILVFTSPMVIAILAAIFLGERITSKKTLALVVGFCGVVVAVAPWSHAQRVDRIGVISCVVCVSCFSVNMVWSRVLTRTEPPESLAFCSGVATAIAGLALSSVHARPLTPAMWVVIAMMGIFCAAGTLSFYHAVKHTSASNVSQYHYTQLVTGTLVSYLVWRDNPGVPVMLGGGLILGSGALIAMEARRQSAVPGLPADEAGISFLPPALMEEAHNEEITEARSRVVSRR